MTRSKCLSLGSAQSMGETPPAKNCAEQDEREHANTGSMTRADQIYWLGLFAEIWYHTVDASPEDEATKLLLMSAYRTFCTNNNLTFTPDPDELLYHLRMEASHRYIVKAADRTLYFKHLEPALEFSETINGQILIIS
jgi:hypothetical protein